jgi:hypothetical protein
MKAHRRGFVRQCFGIGAGLSALPMGSSQASEKIQFPEATITTALSEYEHVLSHTNNLHIFGHPRSWSLVTQGLHPFAPQRVVVMRQREYFDRGGRDLRRQIDKQIEVEFGHMEGFNKKWFPDCKRESLFWMSEWMCSYYGVPYFSDWVVGLAGREIFCSSGRFGMGMPHQYQSGGQVPVDNPPVDWWLFLFPEGLDWAAMDERPVYAVITHVAHIDASYRAMLALWFFTESLRRTDWADVAKMGRIGACRYLNRIIAQCLAETAR